MAESWSKISERGSVFWIQVSAWIYKILGRTATLAILSPIIFFYYLTGAAQRRASKNYLMRIHRAGLLPQKPGFFDGMRHFISFAGALIDRLAGWTGKISNQDVSGVDDTAFANAKADGRGGLILTAHIGNPDLIRAVATVKRRFKVTVLMHSGNAQKYNSVIQKFSPDSGVRVVEVSTIDMQIAMRLSEAVERGEWIVIAADRLPPRQDSTDAGMDSSLLGGNIKLPVGPFVLASALKCPVYFLVCLRTKGKPPFKIVFEKLADKMELPRRERNTRLQDYMTRYVACLTKAIELAPYQWFNFYDFWNSASGKKETK